MFCLLVAFAARGGERPGDWTGRYSNCDKHSEVLTRGPMHLGVRFSTSNRGLAIEFARAMSFWATILDMDWHEEESRNCAIQIVDGHASLFKPAEVARAQFPEAPSFQGWIAFNPGISMPSSEQFLAAVHELGHVLGLKHSANPSSVMYFLRLDGVVVLDEADVAALAARHRLRLAATTGTR